jgi:molybdate/tungstate transport system substrate-binding protein
MKRSTFVRSGTAAAVAASTRLPALAATDVSFLYAGSLVTIVERSLTPALAKKGITLLGEPKGSVALANLIKAGLRRPDVFVSADAAVIANLVGPSPTAIASWYASFASTRLVIGYSPASPFAHDFVEVARGRKALTSVLLEPGLKLGRTDPALDPKGYRAIIAAKLLEADGGPPNFAARLLGDPQNETQVLPEETTLVRLESGEIDAAFLYATESVARRVPAVELPKTANLGDPAYAAQYATQSVTIKGITRKGAPAVYALTIPNAAPHKEAAAQVVAFLLSDAGKAIMNSAGVTTFVAEIMGDKGAVPRSILEAATA